LLAIRDDESHLLNSERREYLYGRFRTQLCHAAYKNESYIVLFSF